jgi:hypothetical protein
VLALAELLIDWARLDCAAMRKKHCAPIASVHSMESFFARE